MNTNQTEWIRLNKFLSDAGVCSRREADRLVEQGVVTVNEEPAVLGMRVSPHDRIRIHGKDITVQEKKVYLILNKPRGIVCTAEKREKDNVIRYVNYPIRIYPAGRLDKDSEGLLILTNDGEMVDQIMRARNFHEKEYLVWTDREITDEFVKCMSKGIPILDTVTRPCKVKKESRFCFRIVLTQGLNRQIRRMCEFLGYRVVRLQRVRIMNLTLQDLPTGSYREMSPEEVRKLLEMAKGR